MPTCDQMPERRPLAAVRERLRECIDDAGLDRVQQHLDEMREPQWTADEIEAAVRACYGHGRFAFEVSTAVIEELRRDHGGGAKGRPARGRRSPSKASVNSGGVDHAEAPATRQGGLGTP